MMKSYKNKNYEQALIETIIKFDELLKNETINEYLKHYSKRRVQNNNNNFNLELMSNKNLPKTKENNNTNINNKINNDISSEKNYENNSKKENENDDFEKEIADFDNEFHKICQKIKDDNEIFPPFDDKMKMKIIEGDYDGIFEYFNCNLDLGETGCVRKEKNPLERRVSRSLSFNKNYFFESKKNL